MKNLNDITVYKNFASDQEIAKLRQHAKNMFEQKILKPNPAGPFRHLLMLDKDHDGEYLTPFISAMFDRIANVLEFKNSKIDPMLGIVASYIEPGGFIHKHKDKYTTPAELGQTNFRFNLMVERGSSIEYNPIINNSVYEVKIGDAWSFNASKYKHETKILPGPEPRIVYQFGFII